jgi:glycosyltransferase involved in cell wall biosynthesis
LSYDQKAVEFLSDPANVEKIDTFVFVSHWQSEMYRKVFKIPGYKTEVIKNACIGLEQRPSGKRDKVRLCYISTPWRGLDVLLKAWKLINRDDVELHVFSSTKIYGKDFAISAAGEYEDLFDQCRNSPGIVYRGFSTNESLRKELHTFDILAYPNTFEETSCIAVIEALCAGLRVVTSNIGALPETTEGWAKMYPYLMDKDKHAEIFAGILQTEIDLIKKDELNLHLEAQKQIYAPRWSWDTRINEWKSFLNILSPISEPNLETLQNNYITETQFVGL